MLLRALIAAVALCALSLGAQECLALCVRAVARSEGAVAEAIFERNERAKDAID